MDVFGFMKFSMCWSMWQAMVKVHIDPYMSFCELNDKAIKGLTCLSKIVSKFYVYIHELLLTCVGEWILCGSHWRRQAIVWFQCKVLNIKQHLKINIGDILQRLISCPDNCGSLIEIQMDHKKRNW
jgi:hypothetical protein